MKPLNTKTELQDEIEKMESNLQGYKTYTVSPTDHIKMKILKARDDAFESYEIYCLRRLRSGTAPSFEFIAKLRTLFNYVAPAIKRADPDTYRKILIAFRQRQMFPYENALNLINEYLDNIGLTKFDNRASYNQQILEEENAANDI